MLSKLEVGQFLAFGYIILRDCLSQAEVNSLQIAHGQAIEDAAEYDYFGQNGTRMVSPFVTKDNAFSALIEHPKVMEAMRDIWGTECLYIGGSDLWSNYDDTPWHSDGDPGRTIKTLKVAIYLDEQDGDQGALYVIPGSHHPEFCAAIFQACGYWEEKVRPRLRIAHDKVPGAVALQTKPGDVVLWDNRIWHAAWKRQDGQCRRTMFLGYAPDPGDDLLAIKELRTTIKASLGAKQSFVYNKAMLESGGPARERMARRLEELGVDNVRE